MFEGGSGGGLWEGEGDVVRIGGWEKGGFCVEFVGYWKVQEVKRKMIHG